MGKLRLALSRKKVPRLVELAQRRYSEVFAVVFPQESNEPPMGKARNQQFEHVEPIGARVLVRKDEPKRETKGGIALPDQAEIPTITGRIVTISTQIENDPDVPLRQYDKILFHPKNAIPVDFEPDNQLFVVPVEDVVAVFRREIRDED